MLRGYVLAERQEGFVVGKNLKEKIPIGVSKAKQICMSHRGENP
jgi:hypothetical protein